VNFKTSWTVVKSPWRNIHASWIAQMEENERLHPGIHDRLYEYLMAKYPGPGVEADAFFGLEESDGVSTK
jgi:hypothetical protein